ncbi:MAG: hypothetical protein A2103_00355 [Gammaproteobacteria bacterium GWF2_41_13]|nr:MAG: hypothetical protein A2103_00355 [Gammaproteobacteria bacterium GWF2_41_13]
MLAQGTATFDQLMAVLSAGDFTDSGYTKDSKDSFDTLFSAEKKEALNKLVVKMKSDLPPDWSLLDAYVKSNFRQSRKRIQENIAILLRMAITRVLLTQLNDLLTLFVTAYQLEGREVDREKVKIKKTGAMEIYETKQEAQPRLVNEAKSVGLSCADWLDQRTSIAVNDMIPPTDALFFLRKAFHFTLPVADHLQRRLWGGQETEEERSLSTELLLAQAHAEYESFANRIRYEKVHKKDAVKLKEFDRLQRLLHGALSTPIGQALHYVQTQLRGVRNPFVAGQLNRALEGFEDELVEIYRGYRRNGTGLYLSEKQRKDLSKAFNKSIVRFFERAQPMGVSRGLESPAVFMVARGYQSSAGLIGQIGKSFYTDMQPFVSRVESFFTHVDGDLGKDRQIEDNLLQEIDLLQRYAPQLIPAQLREIYHQQQSYFSQMAFSSREKMVFRIQLLNRLATLLNEAKPYFPTLEKAFLDTTDHPFVDTLCKNACIYYGVDSQAVRSHIIDRIRTGKTVPFWMAQYVGFRDPGNEAQWQTVLSLVKPEMPADVAELREEVLIAIAERAKTRNTANDFTSMREFQVNKQAGGLGPLVFVENVPELADEQVFLTWQTERTQAWRQFWEGQIAALKMQQAFNQSKKPEKTIQAVVDGMKQPICLLAGNQFRIYRPKKSDPTVSPIFVRVSTEMQHPKTCTWVDVAIETDAKNQKHAKTADGKVIHFSPKMVKGRIEKIQEAMLREPVKTAEAIRQEIDQGFDEQLQAVRAGIQVAENFQQCEQQQRAVNEMAVTLNGLKPAIEWFGKQSGGFYGQPIYCRYYLKKIDTIKRAMDPQLQALQKALVERRSAILQAIGTLRANQAQLEKQIASDRKQLEKMSKVLSLMEKRIQKNPTQKVAQHLSLLTKYQTGILKAMRDHCEQYVAQEAKWHQLDGRHVPLSFEELSGKLVAAEQKVQTLRTEIMTPGEQIKSEIQKIGAKDAWQKLKRKWETTRPTVAQFFLMMMAMDIRDRLDGIDENLLAREWRRLEGKLANIKPVGKNLEISPRAIQDPVNEFYRQVGLMPQDLMRIFFRGPDRLSFDLENMKRRRRVIVGEYIGAMLKEQGLNAAVEELATEFGGWVILYDSQKHEKAVVLPTSFGEQRMPVYVFVWDGNKITNVGGPAVSDLQRSLQSVGRFNEGEQQAIISDFLGELSGGAAIRSQPSFQNSHARSLMRSAGKPQYAKKEVHVFFDAETKDVQVTGTPLDQLPEDLSSVSLIVSLSNVGEKKETFNLKTKTPEQKQRYLNLIRQPRSAVLISKLERLGKMAFRRFHPEDTGVGLGYDHSSSLFGDSDRSSLSSVTPAASPVPSATNPHPSGSHSGDSHGSD